jgi:hypothetical protein
MCSCFLSCEIENAETSTREDYSLEEYASDLTNGRVVFPLAMMETAFNIETYVNAPAEEKVKMTYIFNSILQQGNNYAMKNFYSFYLIPDGNSIHMPGAIWQFSAFNYGSYTPEFTLRCIEEGKWDMTVNYDNGQILFNICQLPLDESVLNWEVSLEGSLISGQGRIVEISSSGPITRKVCSDEWSCTTVMTGTLKFNIYEDQNSSMPLDSFTYSFSGQEESNTYYEL